MLPENSSSKPNHVSIGKSREIVSTDRSVNIEAARWLVHLRWCAFLAQLAVLLVVGWRSEVAPSLAAGAAVVFVTNLFASKTLRQFKSLSRLRVGVLLILDLILLTAILAFSGGPANPFTILFLVHIILTAVVLGAGWTWAVALSAMVAFGALFIIGSSASSAWHMAELHHQDHSTYSFHLYGMWLAFSLAAVLIASFVCRILSSLRDREEEVTRMKLRAKEGERFASLVTLAAGAAHELGTPLATIAVIAGELERSVRAGEYPALNEDAKTLRQEVSRCKTILDEMRGQADSAQDEVWQEVGREVLESALRAPFERGTASQLTVDLSAFPKSAQIPFHGIIRSLRAVIQNALDSISAGGEVIVRGDVDANEQTFSVVDTGAGMSPAELAHATEPFFTTKPVGQGMGLGLFLARVFCEKNGGRLEVSSSPNKGTEVRLRLPRTVDGIA